VVLVPVLRASKRAGAAAVAAEVEDVPESIEADERVVARVAG
jgi:hypothetical protein